MEKYSAFIGIDPGMYGGIVGISETDIKYVTMPLIGKALDLRELACNFKETFVDDPMFKDALVFIEKVGAMPKQGVASMFNFGRILGNLEMLIVAHDFAFDRITPYRWQRATLGVFKKGDSKKVALLRVKERYPEFYELIRERTSKEREGLIDAFFIAKYAEMVVKGDSNEKGKSAKM